MPFPDEPSTAIIREYNPQWRDDFERLAELLADTLGDAALAIDHVGSTSVPGLAAKDCIDVQVRVADLHDKRLIQRLASQRFRLRREPWNRMECLHGEECRKLVFAPPPGARRSNIHVRQTGGPNVRFALLFRDYLRADNVARSAWGQFKQQLAMQVPDLSAYGTIKAPAAQILMAAAERWAVQSNWSVTFPVKVERD